MGRLFGTDGIRGIANRELTADLAFALGRAVGSVLATEGPVLVGRDTRASGEFLEAALCAGVCSVGNDAWTVGIVSTPAVAYLCRTGQIGAGAMISASHNPAQYNGIKLFSSDGLKLNDDLERELERLIGDQVNLPRPEGTAVGRIRTRSDLVEKYGRFLVNCSPVRLDGLQVVVDCGHGSASAIAPGVLAALGASVITIGADPNGININSGCGSTDTAGLSARVREVGADCGVAYDGDADRVIAVDESGEPVDGDQIIGIIALERHSADKLQPPAVVTTVVSNLGLERTLSDAGISTVQAQVGDRFVLELMREQGISLGGEQSGHIIFADMSTTGDGILTSIQLLALMKETGHPLSKLASRIERCPQFSRSVPAARESAESEDVQTAVEIARRALGEEGRVIIRPSGTEPVVRVMVQGLDDLLVTAIGRELVTVIERQNR